MIEVHLRDQDLEALVGGREDLAAPGARTHADACSHCTTRLRGAKILAGSVSRGLGAAFAPEAALLAAVARVRGRAEAARAAERRTFALAAALGLVVTTVCAAVATPTLALPSVHGVVSLVVTGSRALAWAGGPAVIAWVALGMAAMMAGAFVWVRGQVQAAEAAEGGGR